MLYPLCYVPPKNDLCTPCIVTVGRHSRLKKTNGSIPDSEKPEARLTFGWQEMKASKKNWKLHSTKSLRLT